MVVVRRDARSRLAVLGAVAVLALAPALTSCSDDGGSKSGNTASSTPPPAKTALPPAGDQPTDPAAARAEVTKNWTAFFDPKTPLAQKVKLLEDGERMRPVLAAFAGDKNAAMTSAKVTDVEFTSAAGANVTYDLLVGGNPALPGSRGTSILQNDTWKVSVKTLCGLVELSGVTVQGC
ncbi:hypothetical protein [Streptomyces sp. TLI_105]|uniref:hypothetical protein n=1 Tax=Streptomyces sp. TLI_105 TaxID=1881019 RepID=UPI00089AB6D7|nr:hypothetical protein [Streptomyces sp. TLI_105]SED69579.1 hypothetical protein SAMN05428939_5930 [Streptomyces sp. TLI_105]